MKQGREANDTFQNTNKQYATYAYQVIGRWAWVAYN